MLAQDDTSLEPSWPKMTPRIEFWSIFTWFLGAQNAWKSIQKSSNFQTSIETLFSAHGVHKRSNMKVQNNPNIKFFSAKGQKPENRALAYTRA